MSQEFDYNAAKKNLQRIEDKKQALIEKERLAVLERTQSVLKEMFKGSGIEVFLVGSVVVPGKFHEGSDVDIVLKGFTGDRFELWPELERKIDRQVEVILYEKCSFKDYIDQNAFRVV